MDFTEKDLKAKLKTELVQLAKKMPGYKPKTHNKKDVLIAFLLKKEVEIKPTRREELLAKASKYVDFKKTVHGASVAKLEAFLASKQQGSTVAVATVEKEQQTDLEKMGYNDLRRLAKKHGWVKRTGTKKELVEFIRGKTAVAVAAAPEGRLAEEEQPVAAVVVREEDVEEWPVSAEMLARHSKTVDDLKKLLKAKGIATGLPRTKKEILDLFQKSRCSFKDFTCSNEEFCDLRNNLCRELNILRNKDKEIKKLAKGLVYIDEEKGRFYGTPESIAMVRQILQPPPVATTTAASEEKKEEREEQQVIVAPVQQRQQQPPSHPDEEEQGISPININRLLDKPDENEIRRAILHCLGLYHDVDPNDEIILAST